MEAVLRGIGKAAELIDLTRHRGVHPRIGATDVVPFVPIEGVTLEDCAQMARQVGAEVWRRYRIPVYLYESAATRPERVQLENLGAGNSRGCARKSQPTPNACPTSASRASILRPELP